MIKTFLDYSIEKEKSAYLKNFSYCDLCKSEGKPGIYNEKTCNCVIKKRTDLKFINSGLSISELRTFDEKIKTPKKIESLLKNPRSFTKLNLGLFLYGDKNTEKDKILTQFFMKCLNEKNVSGILLLFSELLEFLRRRKMDNEMANYIDKLLKVDLVYIKNINDDIDNRLWPDFIQIIEQIFIRQKMSLLLSANNVYSPDDMKMPKTLKHILFSNEKIRSICFKIKNNKIKQWDGRMFNQRGL